MSSYLQNHINFSSRGLKKSRDKLKPLYLLYHSDYGHQTCYDADITWQALNHKVIQSFDHVFLQGHVTNKSHYISITRVFIVTQLGNDDFPWWDPTYNVIWPFDHMSLWDKRFTHRSRFSTQTLLVFDYFLQKASS